MEETGQVTLTREELYQKVWETPLRTLAKEYHLSDVGLAKICKKHQIPRPGVGYWSKLEFGKPVEQELLPEVKEERLRTITIHSQASSTGGSQAPDVVDPQIAAMIANERSPEAKIMVSPNTQIRHPLVKATQEAYAARNEDQHRRVHSHYDFTKPHFEVAVSKKNLLRALRILQAFVTACEKRGFEFVFDRNPGEWSRDSKNLRIRILGEEFRLSFWEPSKRIPLTREERKEREKHPYTYFSRREEFEPTGILELHLNRASYSSNQQVRDTKKKALEDRLNEFICKILKEVDERKVEAEQKRIEAERKAERKRIATENEILRRAHNVRAQDLIDAADLWEQVRKLEVFIEAVRSAAISRNGRILAESEIGRWLEWAEQYLIAIDPLGIEKALPRYSLKEQQIEDLRRECVRDWSDFSESFRTG